MLIYFVFKVERFIMIPRKKNNNNYNPSSSFRATRAPNNKVYIHTHKDRLNIITLRLLCRSRVNRDPR